MTPPLLKFDFQADIRAKYEGELKALGMSVKPTDNMDELIVRYFSIPNRRIEPRPRGVVRSAAFIAEEGLLSADYKLALERIAQLATSGGDLNPYQSRDLAKRPWKADPQHLEWGITHFHLGLKPHGKWPQLVESTSDLLFVVVKTDMVYFVAVRPHDSFSDQEVFDLAVKEWPYLAEHAALRGVIGLEHNPTGEERAKLRAANINVLTQGADGRVYAPIGGGRTTSGASLSVVRAHLLPRSGVLRRWQHACEKDPDLILSLIPDERRSGMTVIELHASEDANGVISIAATNLPGGRLVLGSGDPPERDAAGK